jgi:hypothetical protein
MYYDPIKRSLGNVFNRSPWLRRLFYNLLDLLLLRTWHVHRELRQWAKGRGLWPVHLLAQWPQQPMAHPGRGCERRAGAGLQ